MIETTEHDDVREIRLARPPVNALDPALLQATRAALGAAVADGKRAVVLSGAPGLFSGGLDVPALLRLPRDGIRAAWNDFFGLMRDIATSEASSANDATTTENVRDCVPVLRSLLLRRGRSGLLLITTSLPRWSRAPRR